MKLGRLLKIHDRYQRTHGVSQVLGDGFLIAENFVYRNIRAAVRAAGFKLVEAWPDYVKGSLFQLDHILESKRVPLLYNTHIFKAIEAKRKNALSLDELPMPPCSYTMHESAHCVAETLLKDLPAKTRAMKLLKMVMTESFANTVDAMGSALVKSETHSAFYEINSYRRESDEKRELRRKVIKVVGFQRAFVLVFYSYVYANFLYTEFSPALVKQALAWVGLEKPLSNREFRDCVSLFNLAAELPLQFRGKTTGFYFKNKGYDQNIIDLLDFDFVAILTKQPAWREAVSKLAAVVELGPGR